MPRPKPSRLKTSPAPPLQEPPSAFEQAMDEMRRQPAGAFPDVPVRWLVKALVMTLAGILVLIWLALCLLYWQGSWQLLYHPVGAMTRTPATVGLGYEPVQFAPDQAGAPQLAGWWVPVEGARFTVLYLHGADGNLGGTVDSLAALHRAGLAVFAIDYQGYGQSRAARPSEAGWLEDAGRAVAYLTQTRHVEPGRLIVFGEGLGANLAEELAAQQASLAGVVLDQPAAEGAGPIFADPRSRMVPARWLVKDRWDLTGAAGGLAVPSLWFMEQPEPGKPAVPSVAYETVKVRKSLVWLHAPVYRDPHFEQEMSRWLGDLGGPQ